MKASFSNLNQKILKKVYVFYENWIIPPQNKGLLQLKIEELKEKTKYMDPKINYALSQQEKKELRDSGYFVDYDERTFNQIKRFSISSNRHYGRYKPDKPYYNLALYQTKDYFCDQKVFEFSGDYHYYNKLNRRRTMVKRKSLWIMIFFLYFYYLYWDAKRQIIEIRRKNKNNSEINSN